jgi:hypothetical protein
VGNAYLQDTGTPTQAMTVKTNVPTSFTPPFPNILSARRAALTLEAAAFQPAKKLAIF